MFLKGRHDIAVSAKDQSSHAHVPYAEVRVLHKINLLCCAIYIVVLVVCHKIASVFNFC